MTGQLILLSPTERFKKNNMIVYEQKVDKDMMTHGVLVFHITQDRGCVLTRDLPSWTTFMTDFILHRIRGWILIHNEPDWCPVHHLKWQLCVDLRTEGGEE